MPRVAIIHSAFDPRLNYIESICARTVHRLGWDTWVFTTTAAATFEPEEWGPVDAAYPFRIHRAPVRRRFGATIFPDSTRVIKDLREFAPDVAFLFAPHQGPGALWLDSLPKSCRVISGFSDLRWHPRNALAWWVFKKRWMKRSIHRSEMALGFTKETCTFLTEMFPEVEGKLRMQGLCYDDQMYDGVVSPLFGKTASEGASKEAVLRAFRVLALDSWLMALDSWT